MIVEIDGQRRRKTCWEAWKRRGSREWEFTLLVNSRNHHEIDRAAFGMYRVRSQPDSQYLALSRTAPGWRLAYRNVSWRDLPESERERLLHLIATEWRIGLPLPLRVVVAAPATPRKRASMPRERRPNTLELAQPRW